MRTELARFAKALWKLAVQKDGQDLVEYALIIALMTLAATAGLKTPATAIYRAFTTDASVFSADVNGN